MADLKISQLSDGGASQAADEYVVARSGNNFRIDGASVASAATQFGAASTALNFGGTALRLDASGNLGLGVTPSAWAGGYKGLQVLQGSLANNGGAFTSFNQNCFFDGSNWKYIGNGNATQLSTGNGKFEWNIAPSGTGGNTITGANAFVQAMTLDASGNLGIGTTSPSTRLHVAGSSPVLVIDQSAGTTATLSYRNGNSEYASVFGNSSNGELRHTSGPSVAFGGFHTFYTDTAERARITSGGQFQINTAATGYAGALHVQQATSASEVFSCWNSATTGDNVFIWFGTETGGSTRGTITYNRAGGLVAYNTTSDYRAKDIDGPLVDAGDTIDALKVYVGTMKGATVARPMLIAHEAQEVAPYAVTGEKDAVNENGDPIYQQMDHQSLVPLLIAEVQSLRKRIAALEALEA